MSNPYQTPGQTPPGGPGMQGGRAYAENKVKPPAIALLILAPIGAIGMALDLAGRIFNAVAGVDNPFAQGGNDQAVLIGNILGGVLDVAAIGCAIFVGIAAWNMMNLQKLQMARIACIIYCIPCLTACCLLGIPFGVWGLIALNDQAVQREFSS